MVEYCLKNNKIQTKTDFFATIMQNKITKKFQGFLRQVHEQAKKLLKKIIMHFKCFISPP